MLHCPCFYILVTKYILWPPLFSTTWGVSFLCLPYFKLYTFISGLYPHSSCSCSCSLFPKRQIVSLLPLCWQLLIVSFCCHFSTAKGEAISYIFLERNLSLSLSLSLSPSSTSGQSFPLLATCCWCI